MDNNKIHPDFRRLFFIKEGIALAGPNYQNIWILVGIMFVTFVAIGLANGSLNYLRQKMDDPFINWVSLEMPRSVSDRTEKIKEILNEDSTKSSYNYLNVTSNRRFLLRFLSPADSQSYISRGRTIEIGNPVLDEIIQYPNLQEGKGFESPLNYGLLVTKELLSRLGYSEDAGFILMAFSVYGNDQDAYIPLPIIGIVEQLPGKMDFATTPFFYVQRKVGIGSGNPFDPQFTQDLLYFVEGNEDEVFEAKTKLEELTSETEFAEKFSQYQPFVIGPTQEDIPTHKSGFIIGFSFLFDNPDSKQNSRIIQRINQAVLQSEVLEDYELERFYRFQFNTKKVENLTSDRLSVHFDELGQIRSFSEFLMSPDFVHQIDPFVDELGLEIDMAQIEEKENYDFITNLTRVVSLILIGFSVLSISLFTSHMFRKHLDKISRNIGTFKAFGVENQTLVQIYMRLILAFLVGATIVSIFLSWIFGLLGGGKALLSLIGKLEAGQSYFSLFNIFTLVAVVLLLLISLIVLNRTARSILFKSPGDLIYNRS